MKLLSSTTATLTLSHQLALVLEFLEKETAKGECPLAGNSVSMDRCFINKYMPRLGEHLHYRTVDVSTIKELTKRWFPDEFVKAPPKRNTHRALDDIRESIQELQYYRSTVFKKIVQGVLGRRSQHVQGRGGVGLDTKQTPRSARILLETSSMNWIVQQEFQKKQAKCFKKCLSTFF
ncbi:hypothetical protein Y032_0007g3303 [Ancylostoma ceylanicum]|uniref:Exonuclease domain-containing protein n=1 Tax=Ancylostoma ceylanicum TaxID=53326 RepID=A0A016VLY9_9BILA|nr:hypothetical protein Y032_0007g3303 [Ancylostoma ceylanicum]